MAYDIGPRIIIEGEAEFRRELQSISQGVKTLGSEMNVVTSKFIGNENSVEALTAKSDVLARMILSLNEKLAMQQRMLQESAQAYGEADARTQKWQQAVNNTVAELNKAEAQLRQTNEALSTGDSLISRVTQSLTGKLGSSLGLSSNQTQQLASALSGANGGMSSLISSAAGAELALGAFGVVVVGTTKKLVEYEAAAAKQADEVLTLSRNYGIAASDMQKLQYMSELTDVSVETVTGSISKLVRSMDSARNGTGDAAEAFASLGVRVTEADGTLRNSNVVFMESIDALGRVQNATERDAAAMAIFGRSSQDLNGVIALGSEGLREYAEEAANTGYVMSDKMLGILSDADDSTQRLDKAMDGLQNTLGVLVAPAVEVVNNDLADLANSAANAIQKILGLKDAGDQLSGVASTIRDLTAADFQTPEQQMAEWRAKQQELYNSGGRMTTTIIVKNPSTTDNQIVRSLTPKVEAYTSLRGGSI